MIILDKNQQAFFELLRAGLWEKEARLLQYKDIDYSTIMRLAEEQSVVGLVAAGLEHVTDVKVPQQWALQFAGQIIQLEQRNKAMNDFVAWLIKHLCEKDIYAILVKGQGIARCYDRPLWRSSGDVDLLLSDNNYEKAKQVLTPLAQDIEKEFKAYKHIGMTMHGGFVIELHGTLHSRLSKRVDRVVDQAQKNVFYGRNVKSWLNKDTTVFLPAPDEDIIFVFTHILHHFFIDGIGLRQICDWCRLLWTYKESLNHRLLEKRIRKAGLISEWRAFGALAVEYLGMPKDAMPFYSADKKWKRKADKICAFVMEVGNFGHNRKINRSRNYFVGKLQALCYKMKNFGRLARIFPVDSGLFFFHFFADGIDAVSRKE